MATTLVEKKVTWQEFRQMELGDDDIFIYELIDGEIVKRTSPSPRHQRISRKLVRALDVFVEENQLGEVFSAPTDVYFDGENESGVVPDVFFIAKDRNFIILEDEYINGAPDLIVEVISPGSVFRDRFQKKDLYQRFAVKEYWLVDVQNSSVEIYVMRENAYSLHQMGELSGKVTSVVLPGFEVDLQMLFD